MTKTSILLSRRLNRNNIMAISLGIVYLWFGLLKFYPHLSPAEDIAKDTISILFLETISSNWSLTLLAFWETCIGLLLIINYYQQLALFFALAHISLTFTPFFVFPELTFNDLPFSLTLLGQYIVKNIIIISVIISLLVRTYKSSQNQTITTNSTY
ncbi:MAG: doxx family protein [Psychroserpens sp.]|uniref:doxx family protein n=1 Tax=Psychroserpens sp. TaxID=2020870 RepID=UPI0030025BCC